MKRRVTSHDVAKLAGVSRGVVSAVLNGTKGIRVSEETRQLVHAAIEQLGYRVDAQARGMRTGRSQCIAAYGNIANPFFSQVLEGFQRRSAELGYDVLLYGNRDDKTGRRRLVDLFLERKIDGIVTKDSTSYRDEEWAAIIREHRIPFISVEGYRDMSGIASVETDYGDSVKRALSYMQERTGLAPIYVELRTLDGLHAGDQVRRAAYESWSAHCGRRPVIHRAIDDSSPQALADWQRWLEQVYRGNGRIALFVNWSRGAVYLYRAAHELGLRIGRDMYLMAGDNTERVNRYLTPSLASIEIPYVEMGESAAERLAQYIEGSRPLSDTSTVWIESRLIHGGSV